MFGFKKKANAAKIELKKIENRDLMEAIVGGCLLVAAADGEIEKEETDNLEALLSSNEQLSAFGAEIPKTVARFTTKLEANFKVGKMNIMREIRDIASDPTDAEEVFVNMIAIAEADGEVEPAEVQILAEVGKELGCSLRDYGIEQV